MLKVFLAVAAIVLADFAAAAQSPSIELKEDAFRVNGWTAPQSHPSGGWGTVFLIYAGTGKVPPLLGTYSVEAGTLVFHPRYPITAGVHYHAIFRAPGTAMIANEFDGPPRATSPVARVEQVYPTADVLPSNLLRLYVVFSAPMSRGEAAAHIHVEDDKGNLLPDELLPGQELWDPSFRRLTMTFDPGRIKRGLTSNRTIGPPITEGRHYKLVIDSRWPDARGVHMTEGFTKNFTGGPPARIPPDPAQWRVTAPPKASRDALVVGFPGPMNYSLLLKTIQVIRGQAAVAGKITLSRHEAEWRFTPDTPWPPGAYQLIIDTSIEDLAGNHIGEAFDIDIFEKVSKRIERKSTALSFTIR